MSVYNEHVILTPTLTDSVYNPCFSLGGLMSHTITGVTSGIPVYADHFKVYDKDNQNTNLQVWFFDSDPSSSGITDVVSFNVDNNDMTKLICDKNFYHKNYEYVNGFAFEVSPGKILLNGITNTDTIYLTIVERSKIVNASLINTSRINGNLSISFNIIA